MALREVKPFNAEQWAHLQVLMKRGQTEKQRKNLEDAKERIKGIKIDIDF